MIPKIIHYCWFGRGENDILIKWEKVKTVGDDVILVDLGPQDVV